MKFNKSFLEELNNKCDIIELISKYTNLKNSSNNSYVGLCPFHNEKSPSFFVNNLKKIYHCFGCNAGGNIITFFMNIENMSYQETITYLSEYYNLNNNINCEKYDKEKSFFAINLNALSFFKKSLNDYQKAKNYILDRKISKKAIIDFEVGYAPNNNDLIKYLLKNHNLNSIIESGLVNTNNNKLNSFFKDRIIFPIKSFNGNILGFGGRSLNENLLPKYLNSKENFLFKKKYILYSLDKIINKRKNFLILVEGYLDVISLYSKGFHNVIASLGTSISLEQLKLIKKYNNNLIIMFDNDIAGINAIDRIIEKILNIPNFNVKIAKINFAKDPDEFINKYDIEKFKTLLKNSCHYIQYKINIIKNKYHNKIEDTNNKFLCIKEILNIISQIKNPLQKELYIKKISEDFNINLQKLIFNKNLNINNEYNKISKISKFIKAEEIIINILFNNNKSQDINECINKMIDINSHITIVYNKNILKNILNLYNTKKDITFLNLEELLSKNEMNHLIKISTNILVDDSNIKKIFNDCIFLLKARYYKHNNLLKEFVDLNIQRKNIH